MATVPFLQSLSARTGWYTLPELADMIAVSEATPGPIGINMATYVGFRAGGVPGVAAAVLGIVAPSVVIILIIARLLQKFRENRDVSAAFDALRPASLALIASAGVSMARLSLFEAGVNVRALILLALLIPPMLKTKLHPLFFIVLSAVCGILFLR
jgi:chromate transporter